MTQLTSTALVATGRPARYAKQLASHLSRKSETHWDADTSTGWVKFPNARADLTATTDGLRMVLACEADEADRLEGVLGRHLVRFANTEELTCSWTRTDGTPGTEQRSTDERPDTERRAAEG